MMKLQMKRIGVVAFAVLLMQLVPGVAFAQAEAAPQASGQRGALGRRGMPGGAPGATPTVAEIQAWFDAMVVVQAQKVLGLTDAQYPQFVGRLKTLQDTRRRLERERLQLVQQINKLTVATDATPDEAQLRAKLKALDDLRARSVAEIQKAYEGIDQVLDLRQQGRFRVFEEQIERRKLEFLLNARRRAQGTTDPGL